jgi:hypothetical protein
MFQCLNIFCDSASFKDWWWKARLGKAYYQLGMYRDAEKQFISSLKQQVDLDLFQFQLENCFCSNFV